MTPDYTRTITDWVKWWNYHQSSFSNMPLERKVEFQERCIRGLFVLLAATADELAHMEQGSKGPRIIFPTGIAFDEPLHRADQ